MPLCLNPSNIPWWTFEKSNKPQSTSWSLKRSQTRSELNTSFELLPPIASSKEEGPLVAIDIFTLNERQFYLLIIFGTLLFVNQKHQFTPMSWSGVIILKCAWHLASILRNLVHVNVVPKTFSGQFRSVWLSFFLSSAILLNLPPQKRQEKTCQAVVC